MRQFTHSGVGASGARALEDPIIQFQPGRLLPSQTLVHEADLESYTASVFEPNLVPLLIALATLGLIASMLLTYALGKSNRLPKDRVPETLMILGLLNVMVPHHAALIGLLVVILGCGRYVGRMVRQRESE